MAVLAIPVLLAATFAGLRIDNAVDSYRGYSRAVSQAQVLEPSLNYLGASGDLAEATALPRMQPRVTRARAAFNTSLQTLQSAINKAELNQDQRDRLGSVIASGQAMAATAPGGDQRTLSGYLNTIATGIAAVAGNLAQEQPAAGLDVLPDLITARESLADQRIVNASTGGEFTMGQRANLSAAVGRESGALSSLSSKIGPGNPMTRRLIDSAAYRLTASTDALNDHSLADVQSSNNDYRELSSSLLGDINTRLEQGASDARSAAIRDSAIAIGALLAALALALIVARMLLEPIRRVRDGALDVANKRLPEAVERIKTGEEPPDHVPTIPVHTREEMGQLARAVDGMHHQALHLATEQARLRAQVGNMFETLSRRSTSLVNQQLGLIEALERDEDDPQRLDSLFKLDHLAARMRRNGESLLVLAGSSARTATGSDLALADVLRAAVSGVQDYQRVKISSTPEDLVRASAAPDTVHLFAELIDNALAYSPPQTTVTIRGSRAGAGGVLVEIQDNGLGIPADSLDEINLSLEAGAEVTPDTARHMGLFVVSRLAQAHQINVDLRTNPDGGVIASVVLPATMLVERERREVTGPLPIGASSTTRSSAVASSAPSLDADADRRTNGSASQRDADLADDHADFVSASTPSGGATAVFARAHGAGAQGATALSSTARSRGSARARTAGASADTLSSGLPKRRPGATGAGTLGSLDVLRPVDRNAADRNAAGTSFHGSATDRVRPAAYDEDPTTFLDRELGMSSRGVERLGGAGGAAYPGNLSNPAGPGSDAAHDVWEPTWAPTESTFGSEEVWTPTSTEPLLPAGGRESSQRGGPTNAAAFFSARQEVQERAPELGLTGRPTAHDLPPGPSELDGPTVQDLPPGPSELDGPTVQDLPPGPSEFMHLEDTPIFGSMRSQWLTDDTATDLPWSDERVEAGWQAADRASDVGPVTQTESGLPKRRPGQFLVPGAVELAHQPSGDRDPAAVRDKLTRHLAGVHRGRVAASDGTLSDDESGSPEETQRA